MNRENIASRRLLLSLSPRGLKWFKTVTQHQSVKRDPVHGRLHFNVPYKVLTYGQDRVKQSSPETLLDSPVPALTSGPVLSMLVHEEQGLM